MYQPSKNPVKEYTDTVMEFGGLNLRARRRENEFSDMLNMSSREYPLLCPRKRRCAVYETNNNITSFYTKEALLWMENDGNYHRFFVNANENEYFRSTDVESKRRIVGMGAYAVMFPDKKYINLLHSGEQGELGFKVTMNGPSDYVKVIPCTMEGERISGKVSDTAPTEPENGQVWIDTSGEKSSYKKWDEATAQWVSMSTTYVLISTLSVITDGRDSLNKWDVVRLSGLYADSKNERLNEQIDNLNADSVIVYNVTRDGFVIAGIVDSVCDIASEEVVVERVIPDMDFVVECNNRLWGCKYGVVNGKVVNEIYACRQGDFRNWYAYIGVSTDSYAVTVGSEGPFTGAAVYNKCPVFFKENCIHMIYGSTPSSYQLVTINCEGVEKGQGDSVCTADNILYYKGPTGFFAWAGSLPQKISRPLGEIRTGKVIGAGVGDKVYFACGDDSKEIYVYDTYYQLWHKEDSRNIKAFSRDGHILYMLTQENGKSAIESVTDEADISMVIDEDSYPKYEKDVQWAAESVDIGYSDVNMKYIRKIVIRAQLSEGSSFKVLLSCDGNRFHKVGETTYCEGVHTNSISFTPERCEFFRYRIAGKGDVRIVSVSKTMRQGSDKP